MCSVLSAAVLFRYFIRYLWRRLLWPDRCFSSSRRVLFESVARRCRKIPARLALTMKTFVLIVTFAATTDLIGGARTERIASFDDYQACASAGRALYSQQHWECVPENQHPKDAPASR